jgi:hypothetical protein
MQISYNSAKKEWENAVMAMEKANADLNACNQELDLLNAEQPKSKETERKIRNLESKRDNRLKKAVTSAETILKNKEKAFESAKSKVETMQ